MTARVLLQARESAKNEAAVGILRQAVQIDPSFAGAWARLAEALALTRLNPSQTVMAAESAYANARPQEDFDAARRALRLDPDSGEANAVYGMIANAYGVGRGLGRDGTAHLRKAIEIEPSNAEYWYWLYLAEQNNGNFGPAVRAALKVAELDPYWVYNDNTAALAWDSGLEDQARLIEQRVAARHPDEMARLMARMRLARHASDYSTAYHFANRALALARADQRPWAMSGITSNLFAVGEIDQARHSDALPPLYRKLVTGHLPTVAELKQVFPAPHAFWIADETARLSARAWLNSGHPERLLHFYDRAFHSSEEYRTKFANGASEFVYYTPLIARALRQVGRASEADRLMSIGRQRCAAVLRRPPVPRSFQARCALLLAAAGEPRAIGWLQRLVNDGWRPDIASAPLTLASEPSLARFRNDGRLRTLDRNIAAERHRERRELLAQL